MKIGLRCPAHVSRVEEALQYALVAQRGGGRFWLTAQDPSRSILLGASLLGNGFPLPLGIVVATRARGREIARQAEEFARLAGQRVVVAWGPSRSSGIEQFRTATMDNGANGVLAVAQLSRSLKATAADAAGAGLSSTARYVPHDGDLAAGAGIQRVADTDFLFFDIPPARPAASDLAVYETGVVECLRTLSSPLAIGLSTLDRVDDPEFVIGLAADEMNEVGSSRELLILEHALEEASEFVASARAARQREIFGW